MNSLFRTPALITALATSMMLAIAAHAADAQTAPAASKTQYTHGDALYPPVFFQTNVDSDDFSDKLQDYKAFAALDEKSVGLPIGVMVIEYLQRKRDAKGLTSGLLSATTFGLIPFANNKEFSVRYFVFVQGDVIADFHYSMSSADVEMLWGKERDINDDERRFLDASIPKFLNDLRDNEEVQEIFAEYYQYFGTPTAEL